MRATAGGLQSYSMHNNHEYAQLLKILYTINRKEMHHTGYVPHSEIEQIKASMLEYESELLLFNELLEYLEA